MLEEFSLFPWQRQEVLSTARSLFRSGFPISLILLADVIACCISYHFIGKYDYHLQQSILSGYLWVHVFILLFFLRSIDQGFAILASRLFGAKKYQELGALYQKHLLVAAAHSIPVILLLILLYLFLFSSQDEEAFMRNIIPSLITMCLFNSTKHFLIAQNIIITPTIITLILIPVQALLCYIFVDIFAMHVSSVAFAKSITDVIAIILLFNYIRITGVCRDIWVPLTKECLKNWRSHGQQTLKLGGAIFLEFFAYGFTFLWAFMTFLLKGSFEFEIHDAAFALAYALFCIPWGISLAIQTKISHVIVEGSHEKVKKILAAGIALNSIFSLIAMPSIIIFRKQIASYFYTEGPSSEIFENMILFYAIAFAFDSYSIIIGGVLTGIGKEKQVSNAVSYCYGLIGFNGQLLLGIVFQYGYIAIWLCLAVTAFLKFAWLVYELYILDWKEQIQETKRTLGEQASGETQSLIEFTDMT